MPHCIRFSFAHALRYHISLRAALLTARDAHRFDAICITQTGS